MKIDFGDEFTSDNIGLMISALLLKRKNLNAELFYNNNKEREPFLISQRQQVEKLLNIFIHAGPCD